jgi:DNA-binding LytR/AlgR family response regulator
MSKARAWLAIWSGWTALALFFAASTSLTYRSTGRPGNWALTIERALSEWWLWAVLTPLVVWLARRFPLHGPGRVHRPTYLARLPVRTGGRTVFVDLGAVDWLEAADNYVRVHVRQREYLVRDTLAALESQLDPDRFVRIHRSAIVPVDRVAEIRPTSHGDAELALRDGTRLSVSRTFRDRLRVIG